MSYFCVIACCKIIISQPIQDCKSNFVLSVSIFVPAHSAFISHVFRAENGHIPEIKNCNYNNKVLHSIFHCNFHGFVV